MFWIQAPLHDIKIHIYFSVFPDLSSSPDSREENTSLRLRNQFIFSFINLLFPTLTPQISK